MNCNHCHAPLRENARFCGSCGQTIAPVAQSPRQALQQSLQALLPKLKDLDPQLVAGLTALAQNDAGTLPRVLLCGEKGRGKSHVTRMLQANQPQAILIDLPGANDADGSFDREVVPELLQADLVLVVLSAGQLLSETERILIQRRILPLVNGELAFVVTHADVLETEEDRSDLYLRMQRFIAQTGEHPWFLTDLTGPGMLQDYFNERLGHLQGQTGQRWRAKVRATLQALSVLVQPALQDHQQRAALEAAIHQEISLAQTEAQAGLRGAIAERRLSLPERLAALSPERLRREGPALLTGEAQQLAETLRKNFLGSLEKELAAHPEAPLKGAASGVGALPAPDLTQAPPSPELDVRRPRDWRSTALAMAGVSAVLVGGFSLLTVGGGAALFMGAWAIRQEQEKDFLQKLSQDARTASAAWLDNLEQEFSQRIDVFAQSIEAQLLERLQALLPKLPAVPAVLEAIEKCLAQCDALGEDV